MYIVTNLIYDNIKTRKYMSTLKKSLKHNTKEVINKLFLPLIKKYYCQFFMI